MSMQVYYGGVAMREVAGSDSRSIYCVNHLCFSSLISLYKQLVFHHTLMRKGSVGRSCRAIGSKII
jgi:hypothetical protein